MNFYFEDRLSLGNLRLETCTWKIVTCRNLHLGTFEDTDTSTCQNLRLETCTWKIVTCRNLHLGTFTSRTLPASLGNLRLETCTWKIYLGTFTWELSRALNLSQCQNLRFDTCQGLVQNRFFFCSKEAAL